ncbi:MAG: hypothetical protein RL021_812 [Bacteroidota bacterium]|jgi:hypothetical protein
MKSFRNLILVAGSLCLAGTASAQQLMHGELLGRIEDQSVTIQLIFSDSAEVRVEYGNSPGVYPSQTPWQLYSDSVPAEIQLSGLQPDTRYYYRINHRTPGNPVSTVRPEYTFHTSRPNNAGFTFVVQADPHLDNQSDTATYARCLLNQLEDQPDFMIDLGDNVMTDKLKNSLNVITRDTIIYRTRLLRSYYERVNHSVPLFLTLGNHEGEAGWLLNGTPNNVAVWNTLERKKFYLNPSPDGFYTGDTTNHPYVGRRENYYAWTWGDALFIVLDPYWYTSPKPDSLHGWNWTLGFTQYEWLRTTLQQSQATYKFVFSHQLVGGDPDGRGGVEFADRYEWGGDNLDGTPGFSVNRPGWYKPIKELLEENRVTIFFHGHDHFFAKQDLDCLVYQECPQPGHINFNSANQAPVYGYFQGQILPNSGHLRVTVDSSGVRVDYVRAYKAADETATRHNKDISATYFIGPVNCYDSITTSVPVLWNSNYPEGRAYPNPFRENTRIEFDIKQSSKVSLMITDIHGKIVRRLLSESSVPEGTFQVSWDGVSDTGDPAPSGIYIYTLTINGRSVKTGKLILER